MAPKPSVPHSSPPTASASISRAVKTDSSSNASHARAPKHTLISNSARSKMRSSRVVSNRTSKTKSTSNHSKISTNGNSNDDAAAASHSQIATVGNASSANSDENVNTDSLMNTGVSPTTMGSLGSPYNMGMGGGIGMSPYGGMGMGGMGMGMGGMGMGMGMGGMGMGMGGGMGMGAGGSAIMTLNQYLFGFQSLTFSLGQAIQVVGMNTQALHHLYEQIMAMLDQGLKLLQELRTLENQEIQALSEEDQKRRRRLKALRWSLMLGISYAGYSFVAKWLKKRKEFKRQKRIAGAQSGVGHHVQGLGAQGRALTHGHDGSGGQHSSRYGNSSMHNGYGYGNRGESHGQPNYYPSNAGYGYSGDYNNSNYP